MKAIITDYRLGQTRLVEKLPDDPETSQEICENIIDNDEQFMLLPDSPLAGFPAEILKWNPEKNDLETSRPVISFGDALDVIGHRAFETALAKLRTCPDGMFVFEADGPRLHMDGDNGFMYAFGVGYAKAHGNTLSFFSDALDKDDINAILSGKREAARDEIYTWGGDMIAEWEDLMTLFDTIIFSQK